jgi:hypothetical protein
VHEVTQGSAFARKAQYYFFDLVIYGIVDVD